MAGDEMNLITFRKWKMENEKWKIMENDTFNGAFPGSVNLLSPLWT